MNPESEVGYAQMSLRRFLVLVLVATSLSVRADDGWWVAAGGMGSYGKAHPTIRMVSEDLKIQLHKTVAPKVSVDFVFRNEGPATTVTMAFPEDYQMREGKSLGAFRTWVDGKVAKAVRKIVKKGPPQSDPDYGDALGKAVWLKDVAFAANQTRRIRVTYDAYYSGNTIGDLSLQYTLTTGASWKGPIGACKITVDWSALRTISAPFFELPGAQWQYSGDKEMTTTLRNWEPNNELKLALVPGFWNFTVNGNPIDPVESHWDLLPPYVAGNPADPMVASESIGAFFGAWGKDKDGDRTWIQWTNPITAKFGGAFEIDEQTVTLSSGKKVKLRRPGKNVQEIEKGRMHYFIYLKDLTQALGGTFTFDKRHEQVQLRF